MIVDRRFAQASLAARGQPTLRVQRMTPGFGDFGAFGGSWEDWCQANYPDMYEKCTRWCVGDPWTEVGRACRGLPNSTNSGTAVISQIVGSVAGSLTVPLASEYEPMNLWRTHLLDPGRFLGLLAWSDKFPAAIARGSLAYMQLFITGPTMFIPEIGGFFQAMADAKKKGGDDYAIAQVVDPAINKIPDLIGFIIDFLMTGWGALVRKGIQLHANNMQPGPGKAVLVVIHDNWGTFTDVINNPSVKFKQASTYAAIGDALVAANIEPSSVAIGQSLQVFAPVVPVAMDNPANITGILDTAYNCAFYTVPTPQGPVSVMRPNAVKMCQLSSDAVQALITAFSQIKLGDIGPKLAAAAIPIKKAMDDLLYKLANPEQLRPTGNAVAVADAGGNVVYQAPAATLQPSLWKQAGVGAGAGLMVAGPPGAIAGGGVGLMIAAFQRAKAAKGTTT